MSFMHQHTAKESNPCEANLIMDCKLVITVSCKVVLGSINGLILRDLLLTVVRLVTGILLTDLQAQVYCMD